MAQSLMMPGDASTRRRSFSLRSLSPGNLRQEWTPSRTREAIVAYAFLAPFLIFFAVFVLRSIVFSGYMSLHNWRVLAPTQQFYGIRNYQELLGDNLWWEALRNTFVFAVITVVGMTCLALGAALLLNRNLAGRGFFRALFYMPSLLGVGVVSLVWVWLMNTEYGVLNFLLRSIGLPRVNWLGDPSLVLVSLALVTIWWGFGFPMLIFLAGLRNIPETLYEAAKIDGANGSQSFLYITLPLLRPTLLFVTVTGFIAQFQVFGQPYFMTTSGGPGRASYTAILYLYEAAWEAFRMGYAAAVAFTIALILMSITLVQFLFIGRRVEY